MEQTEKLLLRSSPSADVTPEMGIRLGHALAEDYKKVVVGMDLIKSSPMMKQALISGLISSGADVIDIGIVSAPVAANAAKMGDCCVYVTEFRQLDLVSGYLLINSDGGLFGMEQIRHLEIKNPKGSNMPDYKNLGTVKEYYTALNDYNANLLNNITNYTGGTVVLDCNCGMATDSAPQVLNHIGTDTISLNAQKDRNFVSKSLSIKEADTYHIRDLVASDAGSIGISINRVGTLMRVFNEIGEPITDEDVLKILMLFKKPAKIVVPMNISCSITDLFDKVYKIAVNSPYAEPEPDKMEIILTHPDAGSIHKAMMDNNADLGYYDGGFIFSDVCQMPDAIHASVLLSQFSSNNSVAETVKKFPEYYSDNKSYKYSCNTPDFIRSIKANIPDINPKRVYEDKCWRVGMDGGIFFIEFEEGSKDTVSITAESNDRLYLISLMEVIDGLMANCVNGQ